MQGGMPSFSPRILHNGLWSITNVKFLPYRYWWNLQTPKMIANASRSTCAYSSALVLLVSVKHKLLDEHHHSALNESNMLQSWGITEEPYGLLHIIVDKHTSAAALLSWKPFGVLLSKPMGCCCATIGGVGIMCGTVLVGIVSDHSQE